MLDHKNISYFKGLNALRFFAAFLVLMHHSETIRKKNGLYNLEWLGLFRNGGSAVTFFFVLSGFLITYLLLKETRKTGTVHVKAFYMRRVLRIWPLYFLLFLTGTLLLPVLFHILGVSYEMPYRFGEVWYYFVFFLPGLVTFFYGHHLLEPLWSIGVEEVFYLLWAPLVKALKRHMLPVLLSVIGLKALLSAICLFYPENKLFVYLVDMFSFEAMAVGGLGAYFVYHREKPLSGLWIYKWYMQVALYALLGAYLLFNVNVEYGAWKFLFYTPILSPLLLDGLFLYLIIGVSLIEGNLIRPRNRALEYLGEISYGVYMYHMLLIFAIILFLKGFLAQLGPLAGTVVFYGLLTGTVILAASVSRFTFEKYFLKLKDRLSFT